MKIMSRRVKLVKLEVTKRKYIPKYFETFALCLQAHLKLFLALFNGFISQVVSSVRFSRFRTTLSAFTALYKLPLKRKRWTRRRTFVTFVSRRVLSHN